MRFEFERLLVCGQSVCKFVVLKKQVGEQIMREKRIGIELYVPSGDLNGSGKFAGLKFAGFGEQNPLCDPW